MTEGKRKRQKMPLYATFCTIISMLLCSDARGKSHTPYCPRSISRQERNRCLHPREKRWTKNQHISSPLRQEVLTSDKQPCTHCSHPATTSNWTPLFIPSLWNEIPLQNQTISRQNNVRSKLAYPYHTFYNWPCNYLACRVGKHVSWSWGQSP